jgi:hypothetical protein
MKSADIIAAVSVIDAPDAELAAVVGAAAQLKAALAEPTLAPDVVTAARHVCRVLGRVAASDGLHEDEWATCAAAVVRGILCRPELPWIQRAFAAKTVATTFLSQSWGAATVVSRVGVVVRALLDCFTQTHDEVQQRFLKEQFLAVAQRFGDATAAAVFSTWTDASTTAGPQVAAIMLLVSAASAHTHFLAALDRLLPVGSPLATKIPPYAGKDGLDVWRKLKFIAESVPNTAEENRDWIVKLDDFSRLLQSAAGAAPLVEPVTCILRTTVTALKLCEGQASSEPVGSVAEQQLRLMRAIASIVTWAAGRAPDALISNDLYLAGSACVLAALEAAGFTLIADIADAQIPLTEASLVVAKVLSASPLFASGDEAEVKGQQSMARVLKQVCLGALPAIRAARKTVLAYLEAPTDGRVGVKRARSDSDPFRCTVTTSNLCLVVTGQLVQFFADSNAQKALKVAPSWQSGLR